MLDLKIIRWKIGYPRIGNRLGGMLENDQQKATIPALDGMRALACFSVIAFHITLLSVYFVHLWQPS